MNVRNLAIVACLLILPFSARAGAEEETDDGYGAFADCAVSNFKSETQEFLLEDIPQRKEKRAVRSFVKKAAICEGSNGAKSAVYSQLRAALARSAFIADQILIERVSDIPVEVPKPNLGILPTSESRQELTAKYAACLAKSDPKNSLAFIMTKRGSDAQNSKVSEIEGFVDCMPHMSMMNVAVHSLKDQLAVQLFRRVSDSDA